MRRTGVVVRGVLVGVGFVGFVERGADGGVDGDVDGDVDGPVEDDVDGTVEVAGDGARSVVVAAGVLEETTP